MATGTINTGAQALGAIFILAAIYLGLHASGWVKLPPASVKPAISGTLAVVLLIIGLSIFFWK